MKRVILALVVSLFFVSEARGQIAVIDVEANPHNWPKQLAHMIAQLADMAIQATRKDGIWNGRTGPLLNEIAAYSTGDEILYGHDGSGIWREIYQHDHVWEDGLWKEAALGRDWAALNTQQSLLHHLEMIRAEDEADEERIGALQERVDTAVGRNQIEQAAAAVAAEKLHQERKTRAVLMTGANAEIVANGQVLNERRARESQEEYFLCNGKCEENHQPPWPQAKDWGF